VEKVARDRYRSPLETVSGSVAYSLRETMLKSVVKQVPPDILIVDKHPQGLNGELLPALHWLKKNSPKTQIILGLRDILDDPERVEQEWREYGIHRILHHLYDRVWIYTDPNIYPTADVYSFEPDLKRKGSHCGYVVREGAERTPGNHVNETTIVATVGGGHDGYPVLDGTLHAVERLRNGFPRLRLRVYTGPLMQKEEYHSLRSRAQSLGSWVKVERFSAAYLKWIQRAAAIVTMGGYNSMLECVAMGKPTVVVPRETPRREQLIRARVFEEFGFVRLVRQQELPGSELADRLSEILERKWAPAPRVQINLGGFRHILRDIGLSPN